MRKPFTTTTPVALANSFSFTSLRVEIFRAAVLLIIYLKRYLLFVFLAIYRPADEQAFVL